MTGFYSIPSHLSFAESLAKHLQEFTSANNHLLSDIQLYLPTRRSLRVMRDAFLQQSAGRPLILPHMQAIGDVDNEELIFHDSWSVDFPNPINPSMRQVILARLITKAWQDIYRFEDALMIAGDLGRLIDQIHTENCDISDLTTAKDVQEFADHWAITLDFLTLILADLYPAILNEKNLIDPGLHRRLRIESLAHFYADHPPQYPVFIAGSTGSLPATQRLIKTIAQSENGYVVLPGLDQLSDDKSWFSIAEGHPQHLLRTLLSSAKVERSDVQTIGESKIEIHENDRLFLATEMMRPAQTTEKWQELKDPKSQSRLRSGLDNITLCICDNEDEEAFTIAYTMAEIAADESQEKTCSLISPDMALCARVQSYLHQWGITADNSAGTPLNQTDCGRFSLSALKLFNPDGDINPIDFLSLLKNPMIGFENARSQTRTLEKLTLRGVRIPGGFEGFQNEINTLNHQSLNAFTNDIIQSFSPLITLQNANHNLETWITAHIKTLELLAITNDMKGDQRLWAGDSGASLSAFFKNLFTLNDVLPDLSFTQYGQIFDIMLAQENFNVSFGAHPRIKILGQIEARMISADRLILAGLNEGTWPPDAGFDSWLPRSVRADIGLPRVERKITLAAHDFVSGFCAPEVFITRSKRQDGQPTIPSRWLQRLDTVLNAANIPRDLHPSCNGNTYIETARHIKYAPENGTQSIPRPAPSPDICLRPKRFSITDIDGWMRDPYAFYAKRVLSLKKLDPIDMPLSVADRGSLIHEAIEIFCKRFDHGTLPNDSLDILLSIGNDVFDNVSDHPDIKTMWWPRFEKAAKWFVEHEKQWRNGTQKIYSEKSGAVSFSLNGNSYELRGKADRIEKRKDNSIAIIDYKTGNIPDPKDVINGLASQLPLEFWMLQENGFSDIDNTVFKLDDGYYWSLSGNKDGGHAQKAQGTMDIETSALSAEAQQGFFALVEAFDDAKTPYLVQPNPTALPRYNDYEHLQRIAEWSVAGGDE